VVTKKVAPKVTPLGVVTVSILAAPGYVPPVAYTIAVLLAGKPAIVLVDKLLI